MNYQEVLENARGKILNCRVCPVCNGLACGNTMPGPGSKAPGNGAYDNWQAWRRIKLNVDTFIEDGPVDTGTELFGRHFEIPLLSGPIGTLLQYSKEDVTVSYNDGIIEAASKEGFIACFGDGLAPATNPGAASSAARYHAAVIPVFNPLPDESVIRKMKALEGEEIFAMAVVVDSAGIRHMKFHDGSAQSKTVEQLKTLKAKTRKPFIVKGIMTAKGAENAVRAGADAVIVSNHGGRILADVPATADVLPEICEAVKGQTKIFVDGGIRSGLDIFKALAIGADGVMICRPLVPAWFGGGAEGVELYVQKLKAELADAMYMCGARKISDINREMIRYIS